MSRRATTPRPSGRDGRGPARRRGAAGLLALLACAGCAGIPGHSEVMRGDPVAAGPRTPLRVHPATPVPGADPDAIVKGFLMAGSALSDDVQLGSPAASRDYRPAREYLLPVVSERWAPGSHGALIYTGLAATTLAVVEDVATVRATAQAVARLDADGRYGELPTPQTHTLDIRLARDDGEWRIASLPEDFGLWLELFYFNRTYQPFSVAYASPTARTLIPDRRFFPLTSALPTALARAQLDPIPAYLEGAVINGFPPNTRLAVDSVTVRSGIASLDLTAAATSSGAEERRAALAQSIMTLTQATAVAGVSLQFDGRPLELVGVSGPPYDLTALGYERAQGPEPKVVVLRLGERLIQVRPADLRKTDPAQSGPELPRIDARYSKLAVSKDLRDIAAVAADGSALFRFRQNGDTPWAGQSAQQPPFGTQLVRPEFDGRQGIWLAGVAPSGSPTVWVIDTRGEVGLAAPVAVATPWLGVQRIVAMKIAQDAQRVALLLRQPDGRVRVGVSGVVRGQDERPTALTAPLLIGAQIVDAVDLAWTSAYRLTVLARTSSAADLRATHVDLDGRAEGSDLAAVPGARTIVPLGGGHVAVVTGSGQLQTSVAGGWQPAGPVSDIVVP